MAALPLGRRAGRPAPLPRRRHPQRTSTSAGRRRVPDDAPADFVPTRWRDYLEPPATTRPPIVATTGSSTVVYQPPRRPCAQATSGCPAPLRRPGHPPDPHLGWSPLRAEPCQLTGIPARWPPPPGLNSPPTVGRPGRRTSHSWPTAGVRPLDTTATRDLPAGRRPVPDGAVTLCDEAAGRLPHLDLPSLLIEVDTWTGFTDALIHAGSATHRAPDLAATSTPPCWPKPPTTLPWRGRRHGDQRRHPGLDNPAGSARRDPARRQYRLRQPPPPRARSPSVGWRDPVSSDGQRFPQRGKSLTARALSRYFVDEGTTTSPTSPTNTPPMAPKSSRPPSRTPPFILDEILGNPTDLPIAEHTVDTGGQTLALSPSSICSACASHPASGTCPAAASTVSARPRTSPASPRPGRSSPGPSSRPDRQPMGRVCYAWPPP